MHALGATSAEQAREACEMKGHEGPTHAASGLATRPN